MVVRCSPKARARQARHRATCPFTQLPLCLDSPESISGELLRSHLHNHSFSRYRSSQLISSHLHRRSSRVVCASLRLPVGNPNSAKEMIPSTSTVCTQPRAFSCRSSRIPKPDLIMSRAIHIHSTRITHKSQPKLIPLDSFLPVLISFCWSSDLLSVPVFWRRMCSVVQPRKNASDMQPFHQNPFASTHRLAPWGGIPLDPSTKSDQKLTSPSLAVEALPPALPLQQQRRESPQKD